MAFIATELFNIFFSQMKPWNWDHIGSPWNWDHIGIKLEIKHVIYQKLVRFYVEKEYLH